MTEKQKNLVRWIENMLDIKYDEKENLSDWINHNRPNAEIVDEENKEMNLWIEMEDEILNG